MYTLKLFSANSGREWLKTQGYKAGGSYMLIAHSPSPEFPFLGKKIYPLSRVLVTIGNYTKNTPLYRAVSGNLPETTPQKHTLFRENGNNRKQEGRLWGRFFFSGSWMEESAGNYCIDGSFFLDAGGCWATRNQRKDRTGRTHGKFSNLRTALSEWIKMFVWNVLTVCLILYSPQDKVFPYVLLLLFHCI